MRIKLTESDGRVSCKYMGMSYTRYVGQEFAYDPATNLLYVSTLSGEKSAEVPTELAEEIKKKYQYDVQR